MTPDQFSVLMTSLVELAGIAALTIVLISALLVGNYFRGRIAGYGIEGDVEMDDRDRDEKPTKRKRR